ncbi:MAG: RNA-directed DNA polymerase [Bacteroidales bacterium]|jgi:hypothetical protein|nr:RNA-directed DNA polymerase [Bacteroidales bacterium]
MKRKGYLFERIADIDNLRCAFWKAQKGKSQKPDIVAFAKKPDENLLRIREQLLNGSYRFGNYHYFTVYDPKKRTICAAAFGERVVHHAIMNICAADFDNRQIHRSYACRKNRGTFAAVEQAAVYQKKYEWFLKLDVRKYFDSIAHGILFEKLQHIYKDKQLLNMFWKIIDSYHAHDDTGVPIGNLTSQYFANHYLSFADRYAIEQLRVPAYVRYMDDMLLWTNDRTELLRHGRLMEDYVREGLKLALNPAVCNRTGHGLPALGFLLYPNRIRLNSRSRQRFSTKLKQNCLLLAHDEITESDFGSRVLSLYGFINHADSRGFAGHVLQKQGQTLKAPTA